MNQFNIIAGKELRLKLKRKGISSVDIVRDLGYNKSQVSLYFTDNRAMPAHFIVSVASYAKLDISDLVEGGIGDLHVMDLKAPPPAPVADVAAEPAPTYQSKASKKTPRLSLPETLIHMDSTKLDLIIHELYTKMQIMQQDIHLLRQELELAHH
jgi:hypothetical protein